MAAKTSKTNESVDQLIELNELNVNFGRQVVLRDITLSIPRGQTVAIIGESGCGKTVLLKTIVGLLRPTNGHVVFDGQRIDQLGDKELTALRTRFGFLFQGAALFDSMTVAENVAFPLREGRQAKLDEIEKAVAERVKQVGLPTSVLGKRPAQL